MSDRLLAHYETKYAAGTPPAATSTAAATGPPRNRFDACLWHFPEHFRGGAILELAAGEGRVAAGLLASDIDCSEYTISDLAEPRLDRARQTLGDPRARFARMDAEKLTGEPAARYDAIIMIALVEHLIDPLGALREVRRLLRPGGILYIDTPNIAKYTRRLRLLAGRFPSTATLDEGLLTHQGEPVDLFEEGHLHYFTYRSLGRLLTERCGFASVAKLAYYEGPSLLSRNLEWALAKRWPQLFSELCLIARA